MDTGRLGYLPICAADFQVKVVKVKLQNSGKYCTDLDNWNFNNYVMINASKFKMTNDRPQIDQESQ